MPKSPLLRPCWRFGPVVVVKVQQQVQAADCQGGEQRLPDDRVDIRRLFKSLWFQCPTESRVMIMKVQKGP